MCGIGSGEAFFFLSCSQSEIQKEREREKCQVCLLVNIFHLIVCLLPWVRGVYEGQGEGNKMGSYKPCHIHSIHLSWGLLQRMKEIAQSCLLYLRAQHLLYLGAWWVFD